MTIGQHEQPALRPLWMPHPALIALIAVLWAGAAAAQAFAGLIIG